LGITVSSNLGQDITVLPFFNTVSSYDFRSMSNSAFSPGIRTSQESEESDIGAAIEFWAVASQRLLSSLYAGRYSENAG